MKRRCTAFVISDFYDNNDYLHSLQIANRKHDVMAVQVYDNFAKNLPNVGLLRVSDAETGHEMYLDTSSKKVREAHARHWQKQEERLSTLFAKCKVDSTSIATDEDFSKALLLLFKKRA